MFKRERLMPGPAPEKRVAAKVLPKLDAGKCPDHRAGRAAPALRGAFHWARAGIVPKRESGNRPSPAGFPFEYSSRRGRASPPARRCPPESFTPASPRCGRCRTIWRRTIRRL